MKKLILILAIALIASPAFALHVYLEREGSGLTPAVVALKYDGADTANLPRAFAVKIRVNNQAYVDDVTNYKTNGESTSANPGFGIYPATIAIDSSGSVTGWGSPIAASGDPGSSTGIDTNSIVLEFGSLYFGDANAPATSGTLCKLSIVQSTATGSSTVSMADEDVYRGGLVLEDGTTSDVDSATTVTIVWGGPPAPATSGTPTGTCVGVTTDLTWTAGSGATSHDVYFGTSLPGSPTNVTTATFDTGTMANGTTYLCRVIERNAIGTSAALDWSFTTTTVANPATIVSPSNNATGVARAGTTLSWTAGSGAVSHDVYFGTNSTTPASKGNQTATTFATGTMIQGKDYYWRIDEKSSCGATTTGTIWKFTVQECYKTSGASYATWVTLGKPSCWCYKRQCKGDASGTALSGKWVTTADFTIFKSGYNKLITQLKSLPTGLCGDFNHGALSGKPVTTADFTIFKGSYNKAATSVPECAGTSINFWMN